METFAENLISSAYGRSVAVDDLRNANADWRAGYAIGFEGVVESEVAIRDEWVARGGDSCDIESFAEWKVGFWAGRLLCLEQRIPALSGEPGKNER